MVITMNKSLLCSMAVLLSSLIAGCASQPEPVATSHNKEMEAELAEWRKLKPGVQRLVAIEGELKGLLATLETITENEPTAQLATADNGHNVQTQVMTPVHFEEKKLAAPVPVQTRAVQPAEKEINDEILTATLSQTSASTSVEQKTSVLSQAGAGSKAESTSFSLQLASVTKEEAVDPTWTQLKKRHPEVLGALDLHSEQVLIANRTYYRVKAGRFDSYNEAKQSCKLLMSSGASCIVNKG